MVSRGGIQQKSTKTEQMLCPCCGATVLRAAPQCICGARFVGEPLDETPIQVQRLGPAMTSLALLALVVVAALIATKWLAFAGLVVMWSAWRAVRLARQNPGWYGGYKTAVATLTLTIAGSAVLATYGIAHIPQAFENYRLSQIAATQSSIYHLANLLDEYQLANNHAFPRNTQEFKKIVGEALPMDYWGTSIKYQGKNGDIAERQDSIKSTGLPLNHFELRSAGPDGIIGTDDDIVMLDGMFFTNSEAKKLSVLQ